MQIPNPPQETPPPASSDVMQEDETPEAAGQNQPQTVEVALSALGNVKEGDTVSFKVVSVDSQNGVANLAVAKAAAPAGPGGTEGMADEFSSPQNMMGQQRKNPPNG